MQYSSFSTKYGQAHTVWASLLIANASKFGLTPLSKLRFHRLFYFANCLAPVFGITPLETAIVKYHRGPFYPNAQELVDRLVGIGLIKASQVQHIQDSDGTWMGALYRPTPKLFHAVNSLSLIHENKKISYFFSELIRSYALQEDDYLDTLALFDSTYGDEDKSLGIVIDFKEAALNLSSREAESFSELPKNDLSFVRDNDKIHLYLSYLQELNRQQVAGGAS